MFSSSPIAHFNSSSSGRFPISETSLQKDRKSKRQNEKSLSCQKGNVVFRPWLMVHYSLPVPSSVLQQTACRSVFTPKNLVADSVFISPVNYFSLSFQPVPISYLGHRYLETLSTLDTPHPAPWPYPSVTQVDDPACPLCLPLQFLHFHPPSGKNLLLEDPSPTSTSFPGDSWLRQPEFLLAYSPLSLYLNLCFPQPICKIPSFHKTIRRLGTPHLSMARIPLVSKITKG